MTDINEITAGKYELVAELWDETTSKPGQPFDFKRHRKGDVIDLNVEDAKRLYAAGAVVRPGEREQALAALQAAQLKATIAGLSDEARTAILAQLGVATVEAVTGEPVEADSSGLATLTVGEDGQPKKPAQVANKALWVAWAVHKGAKAEDAEQLTKDQLIDQYGA